MRGNPSIAGMYIARCNEIGKVLISMVATVVRQAVLRVLSGAFQPTGHVAAVVLIPTAAFRSVLQITLRVARPVVCKVWCKLLEQKIRQI